MRKTVVAAALALAAPVAFGQVQGVTKTEIVIGTVQDLSGPIVGFSKPTVNGMRMKVDEINEQGGINGRKLKLIVEDHGYDPKKAVLAAQKLIQRDKIFAALGSIGTPTAMAAMPLYLEKNVAHLFPLSGARQMYEPLAKLKYSFAAPYFDQMRAGLKRLVKEKGLKKVCTLYQDDDFGAEVMEGGAAALKDLGMSYAERTTFKRGATEFSSQVQKMQGAGCDAVVMGTIIRETIGTVATARKLGYHPEFIGTSASYDAIIARLGGPAVNGYYSTCQINIPYADDPSKNVRDWYASYKAKFKEDPTLFSTYGYIIISLFQAAAQKAGPNLTPATLDKALESLTVPRDMFGGDEQSFGPKKHLGSSRAKLCQIQEGRWRTLTDYITD
ncbi:MAG TPA: ABC transporter substrate-binding protein [Burkholderiales bacterium]|jgi:branched-chain amino acid transport system substrate-binding protein|nr:ABC transporter substrate-binding protein [Burkholderiales bacterium]